MNVWFKAKVDWADALELLSDAEAGRFVKALWHFAASGEERSLDGQARLLYTVALADLRREASARERISAQRREAGRLGGMAHASSSKCFTVQANESASSNKEKEKEKREMKKESQIQDEEGAEQRLPAGGGQAPCGETPTASPSDTGGKTSAPPVRPDGQAPPSPPVRTNGQAPSAPPAHAGGEAVAALPLCGGGEWPVSAAMAAEWAALFPAVDVPQQLRGMRGWLTANPKRRKTAQGVERFCVSWLMREQDRARAGPAAAPVKRVIEQQYEQRVYDPAEFEGLSPEQLEELAARRASQKG